MVKRRLTNNTNEQTIKQQPIENEPIVLPRSDMRRVIVRIVGATSLIINANGEKTKNKILDSMNKNKEPKEKRLPRTPEQEYKNAMYTLPGQEGTFIKCISFKRACVNACRLVGDITMVLANTVFHVLGDFTKIEGEPRMHSDMARNSNGGMDLRFRPEYPEWATTLTIEYNSNIYSLEKILHLLQKAGEHIGVGEKSPHQNGDNHGLFKIVEVMEIR